MRKAILATALVLLVSGTALAAGTDRSAPQTVDPSNFVAHVTNPYFPLMPGTVLTYKGIKDGQRQIDRVTVLFRTRTIEGVKTTVVHDVATHQGHVLEATFDYYAQDTKGTVYYFGEDTKSYEDGQVSTEGSWLAGKNGAVPGIIMRGDPKISDGYRQEYYKGHAEDQAWVVQWFKRLHVPYGNVGPILRTLEFSRLEPLVIDEKDYARGIGIVSEVSRTGARETALLVHVHRPAA